MTEKTQETFRGDQLIQDLSSICNDQNQVDSPQNPLIIIVENDDSLSRMNIYLSSTFHILLVSSFCFPKNKIVKDVSIYK